jgi:hypothetical protein
MSVNVFAQNKVQEKMLKCCIAKEKWHQHPCKHPQMVHESHHWIAMIKLHDLGVFNCK